MTQWADYGAERAVNHLCKLSQPGLDRPSILFIHLHTGDPGDAGTANEVSTAVWTNYASVRVYTDGATTPYMTSATKASKNWISDNSQKITFTNNATMVTEGTTLNVTHFSVRNNAGYVLFKGALTATAIIKHGAPIVIGVGAFDIIAAVG